MIKQNERILHFLPRMTNSCYATVPGIIPANTIPVLLRATIKQVKDDAGKTCFPWNWDKGVVCVTMTLAWCSSLQWADYRRLPANNVTVRVRVTPSLPFTTQQQWRPDLPTSPGGPGRDQTVPPCLSSISAWSLSPRCRSSTTATRTVWGMPTPCKIWDKFSFLS